MKVNQNLDNLGVYPENQRRFGNFHKRKLSQEAKIVGNYRITKKLGSGAIGQVYTAYLLDNNKKFAVKILPKTPENFQKIQKQVQIHQCLNHKSIVKFQQVIYEQNRAYIFMEHCSNGDLFSYIKNKGQLGQDHSAQIFIKIYQAVLFLHEKGITHRDIKAENILLDQKLSPKLSDFGLASFYNKDEPFLDTYCGSFNYAAPQIIKKRKYKPELVDLWSLTVALYAMLTCKQPFNRQGAQKLATKNYIVGFNWDQSQKLSKEAIQFFSSVFVPSQHRISLFEVKNSTFFKKYEHKYLQASKHSIDKKIDLESQLKKSSKNNVQLFNQSTTIALDADNNSYFSQFQSQDIENPYKIKNKIELIRSLRRKSRTKSVEPADNFRITKKPYLVRNDLFQYY